MANFRATIQGQRGAASRLGSKKSGLTAHINGWQAGVSVYASHVNGVDEFHVYRNAGSNGGASDMLLAIIRDGNIINRSEIEASMVAAVEGRAA